MNKPTKHSVAVLVRRRGNVLTIRRPDDDDELPGIWGLPAGSYRQGESLDDLIRRIGREKIGVELTPVRVIAAGAQDRPRYRLEMELWEASMEGVPNRAGWKWAPVDVLKPGAAAGSLCCALAGETSTNHEDN
jgi:ADP-ribose pyrophosphatase YjhB (NUDIX family)